jgi:hypothetical protein
MRALFKGLSRLEGSMAKHCETCRYFRAERHVTELLRLSNSIDLQQNDDQMYQREQELLSQEYVLKQKLINAEEEKWPFPAQVLSYCGFREDQGVWLVHELKNKDHECDDHAETEGERACATCVHNVVPGGAAEDGRILWDMISPANNMYTSGGISGDQFRDYSGEIKGNLDRVMRVSSAQQGMEMQQAFHGRGVLPRRPRYYAYCTKYSSPERYVLSRYRNPDHRCPGWSTTGYDEPHTPASDGERAPGPDPYVSLDQGDGVDPLLKIGLQILKGLQRKRES